MTAYRRAAAWTHFLRDKCKAAAKRTWQQAMISVQNNVINNTQTHTHIRTMFSSVFHFKWHFIISCFYGRARASQVDAVEMVLWDALATVYNLYSHSLPFFIFEVGFYVAPFVQ